VLLTDQFGCFPWEEGTFEKVDNYGRVYNTAKYIFVNARN
jgi:hypothetical protein